MRVFPDLQVLLTTAEDFEAVVFNFEGLLFGFSFMIVTLPVDR